MIDPSRIPVPVIGEQATTPPPPEGLILLPQRVGYMKVPMQGDPGMIQGLLEQVERVDQRQIWIDIYLSVISGGTMGSTSKVAAVKITDDLFEGYMNKFRTPRPQAEQEADEPII